MDTLLQNTSELEQFERLLAPKEFGELFKLQGKVYTFWSTQKKPGFTGVLDFEWKRMRDAATGESYMAVKQVREVPQKLYFGLSEPNLILTQNAELTVGSIDGSVSLEALMTSRKIRLNIPKFTSIKDVIKIKNEAKIFTAGHDVGIRQVDDKIWLVSFMDYDMGFFDTETCRVEPTINPFGSKVLPMSSVRIVRNWWRRSKAKYIIDRVEPVDGLEVAPKRIQRSNPRCFS